MKNSKIPSWVKREIKRLRRLQESGGSSARTLFAAQENALLKKYVWSVGQHGI